MPAVITGCSVRKLCGKRGGGVNGKHRGIDHPCVAGSKPALPTNNKKYMVEFLSKCCEEIAKTSIADEGTGCFVCHKCGKPCDVIVTRGQRQKNGFTNNPNRRGANRHRRQNAKFDTRRKNNRNEQARRIHHENGAANVPKLPNREIHNKHNQ